MLVKSWGLAAIGLGLVVFTTIMVSRGVFGAKDSQDSRVSKIANDVADQARREWRGEQPRPIVPASDANFNVVRSREDVQSQAKQGKPVDIAQGSVSDDRQVDSAAPDKFELMDARTAIGRPFPVSPSVERECMRAIRPGVTCIATREFLAELSKEPRNIPWARDQERRLEAGINALGPDKYAIRSIECRSTRCAVEVAANDVYLGDIEGDPELEQNLLPGIATLALEKGSNGERIVVTVSTFERR